MTETAVTQEKADSSVGDIFVARQPIFDADLSVHAYELLYRSGDNSVANVTDGNAATSQVMINAFLGIGIETLTDNRLSFINLTREFIVGHYPMPLPPESVVLEILEDIEVDDELLSALKGFSQKGYTIALDDYVFEDDKTPLFDIIDIIKIDLMECDRTKLEAEVDRLKFHGVKLLAEKVETQEEFELCKELGFDYYQGYFFSKPTVLSGQALKTNRIALMEILATLQDPDCDVTELESLIQQDVSISYKILRIINSAFYNLPREIQSIKQAIVALGLKTIREWLTVITLTDIDDKPPELILLTLQRARMLQTLSKASGLNEDAGFTAGLFSSLDAIMDRPMGEVLKQLPLADDLTEALLTRGGSLGNLLEKALNYERGDWEGIDPNQPLSIELSNCYLESLSWASELVGRLKG